MKKNTLMISAAGLLAALAIVQICDARQTGKGPCNKNVETYSSRVILTDTVPPAEVVDIVAAVIYSINTFNIEKVADLYTPNAVVADDEPPYSWNGPTAGVQWVNAVEQACRDNRLTKLKGTIEAINVFHQTAENVYVVVPVTYTGDLPRKRIFKVEGAFTFVLRMIDGKWMIKSQVWMPKNALSTSLSQ
jgi:ketosteroid isomerase-like protein